MQRLGRPEEVAETVAWMCKVGYVTNKIVGLTTIYTSVDGGLRWEIQSACGHSMARSAHDEVADMAKLRLGGCDGQQRHKINQEGSGQEMHVAERALSCGEGQVMTPLRAGGCREAAVL
ncbi:hypothetical protein FH972_025429 [Carpinus fangiana]|uniref:Uncharacterized protein n=1 Tax=Carpinus fangiana TaxID=176857 RepID=A0A5N6L108_9ROSI|nr:hypothetical protein FH972_025429 [Carpinus fangiana]